MTIQAQILELMRRLQSRDRHEHPLHHPQPRAWWRTMRTMWWCSMRGAWSKARRCGRCSRSLSIRTRRGCWPACRARRALPGQPQAPSGCSRSAAQVSSPLAPPPGCAFEPRCDLALAGCRRAMPPLIDTDKARRGALHSRAAGCRQLGEGRMSARRRLSPHRPSPGGGSGVGARRRW